MTLAAQLSAFPDIKTAIVEQKPGPLLRGQAAGIVAVRIHGAQRVSFRRQADKLTDLSFTVGYGAVALAKVCGHLQDGLR